MNKYLHLSLISFALTLSACVSQSTFIEDPSEVKTELSAHSSTLANLQKIKALPKIQKAFAKIESMEEENILRLIEMTEIPAPPFMEEVRAKDFVQRLKNSGLSDVYIDDVGNVIARRPGIDSTKVIALASHLDTVFPAEMDIKVKREGKKLTAPGVGDNTRALVATLTLVEMLEQYDIQTQNDILFIGSVGEEGLGDLRGVRHLFSDSGIKIDSFIAMDGGSDSRLIVDAVGSNRYKVSFSGPGGHSYGAYGRAHPHQALAEAIAKFTADAKPITQQQGLRATFSVGRIGGGTSINSIPFSSWMEVDMRSQDKSKLAALDKTFQASIAYALEKENTRRLSDDALSVEIKSVGKRPAGSGDRNNSLVQNALASLEVLGVTPKVRASSTDSNIPISLGIPAITISRGGKSKDAHSPDESWESIDAHLAIQAALLLLVSEAGVDLE